VSEGARGSVGNLPLVLVPIFNDWQAVGIVIAALDRSLAQTGRRATVLLVDDASTDPAPERLVSDPLQSIESIEVLRLRCNLGHERAICVGLTFVEQQRACSEIVVMDGDGEDRPEDVSLLLDALESGPDGGIVFAKRVRRSESRTFRFFYGLYRLIHWILVGAPIEVGSFSAVSRSALGQLVAVSDLWNHYASAVFVSRIPYRTVPAPRGERVAGRSKLDLAALVRHGLGALSVYGDRIAVRVLVASAALAAGLALFGLLAIALQSAGLMQLPSWALAAILGGGGVLGVLLVSALAYSILILNARGRAPFIPLESCRHFVLEHRRW
jgi:hypothetical protein